MNLPTRQDWWYTHQHSIVMPAVRSPVVHAGGNQWYAMIDVPGVLTAWLCVPRSGNGKVCVGR